MLPKKPQIIWETVESHGVNQFDTKKANNCYSWLAEIWC